LLLVLTQSAILPHGVLGAFIPIGECPSQPPCGWSTGFIDLPRTVGLFHIHLDLQAFQKYKPMCLDADVINKCTKEQMYNSYDNSILYTDYVLNKIITKLDSFHIPYVFIYTSDHGESLGENGRVFHGMPPGVSLPYEQAHIPLLVKSSLPITIVKREEYLQPDIFDTILDLFHIESKIFSKKDSFIKINSH